MKNDIKTRIQSFNTIEFYNSSLNFFNSIGYDSDKKVRLEKPDYENFIEQFLPTDERKKIDPQKALVADWNEIQFLFQLTNDEIRNSEQISIFDSNEVDVSKIYLHSYLFISISLKGSIYTKTDFVNITRQINNQFLQPVLILFHYNELLCLSVIDRRMNKKDADKDVLEKVTLIKDLRINEPHRAHIEILNDLHLDNLNVNNFDELHKALKKILNTKELNKRFYTELSNWYHRAMNDCFFPNEINEPNIKEISLIRFISRILFAWFLKEKGLIPNEIFTQEFYDKEIKPDTNKNSSRYYKAVLQNLFFATLNCKLLDRDFQEETTHFYNKQYMVFNKYRYKDYLRNPDNFLDFFKKVPFLNGGLFDCLDFENEDKKRINIDCFSNNEKFREKLSFPDNLFFETDTIDFSTLYNDKRKNNVPVKGLFDIFNEYKFTIDENTPIDQEIALDPELLGQTLENLLASYNPETQATARKSTGSYYTPREIVDYMVDESLIAYLTQYLKNNDDDLKDMDSLDELLRETFSYTEKSHPFNEQEVETLIDAVFKLKMLDPACGSGAFPMGILLKMVYVLERIDPENIVWKKKLLQNIPDEMKNYIEVNTDNFSRKLGLIWNCIYGVDIQTIAIQLTKLRFFISLIVEETVDLNNEDNFGILPLPNLETKFVAANTLIGIERPVKTDELGYSESNWLIDELKKTEQQIKANRLQYFNANNRRDKKNIKIKDKKLRLELSRELKNNGFNDDVADKIAKWDPYDINHSADWFDPEYMFMVTNGFDIVIGNPPYVRADNPAIAKQRKQIIESKQYITLWEKWDLMVPFVEKGVRLLKINGVMTYIMSNSITTSKYALKLHNWILENHFVRFIDYFENISVFDAGVIPVIISLSNSNQKENTYKKIHTNDFKNVLINTVDYNNKENLREKVFKKYFNTIFFPEIDVIRIGNICYLSVGMVINADEKDAKGEFTKNDLISEVKTERFCKKYVEGKNIKEYSITKIKYLEYNTERVPHKLRRSTFPELYLKEKILRGRVTKGTFDDTGIVCNDSIVVFKRFIDLEGVIARSISTSIAKNNFGFKGSKTKEMLNRRRIELENTSAKYLLKYILAIINSKYAMGYLNNFRRHRLKNYFYPDDFRNYPIPQISLKSQQVFEIIVELILFLKTDKYKISEIVTNVYIAEYFEQIIDAMVFELYFPDDFKKVKIEFFRYAENCFEPIEGKTNEEKIIIIQNVYNILSSQNNKIRNNLKLMIIRLGKLLSPIIRG